VVQPKPLGQKVGLRRNDQGLVVKRSKESSKDKQKAMKIHAQKRRKKKKWGQGALDCVNANRENEKKEVGKKRENILVVDVWRLEKYGTQGQHSLTGWKLQKKKWLIPPRGQERKRDRGAQKKERTNPREAAKKKHPDRDKKERGKKEYSQNLNQSSMN